MMSAEVIRQFIERLPAERRLYPELYAEDLAAAIAMSSDQMLESLVKDEILERREHICRYPVGGGVTPLVHHERIVAEYVSTKREVIRDTERGIL